MAARLPQWSANVSDVSAFVKTLPKSYSMTWTMIASWRTIFLLVLTLVDVEDGILTPVTIHEGTE